MNSDQAELLELRSQLRHCHSAYVSLDKILRHVRETNKALLAQIQAQALQLEAQAQIIDELHLDVSENKHRVDSFMKRMGYDTDVLERLPA